MTRKISLVPFVGYFAYLIPGLGLSVAAAGNLSWGLAALGLVAGSLLAPPPSSAGAAP